jgi:tRNA 2-thiouridine synthesizing protein A
MEAEHVTEVDARGLSCPLPVMRTQEAIADLPGEVVVLVDSGTARANVGNLLAEAGYAVTTMQGPDGYRMVAKRG